jgi:hypothetical protein
MTIIGPKLIKLIISKFSPIIKMYNKYKFIGLIFNKSFIFSKICECFKKIVEEINVGVPIIII